MDVNINKNIAISSTGFLFNPLTGDSFNINQVGIEIIKSLQTGIDSQQLIDCLEQKYSVDRITLEKDVDDFIMLLKIYHILK